MISDRTSEKASGTGGVKPFSLEGRLYRERERLTGMTDDERCWRAQWIQDQKLRPNEPVDTDALYKELYNPVRRFYRIPMDKFSTALVPFMGKKAAYTLRFTMSSIFMGIGFVYVAAYYFKYNANDWTRKGGWRVLQNRPTLYSDEPGFPTTYDRDDASEYANRGFSNSPI